VADDEEDEVVAERPEVVIPASRMVSAYPL